MNRHYTACTSFYFFTLLYFLVIIPHAGFSHETDLGTYIRLALENNSELEAAYYEWQSSLFEKQASDTLPDPKIGYGYYIQSVETRVGPQKNYVNASQMIPWLGKLKNRKRVAHQKALIAEQKLYVLTSSLIRKLKDTFYDQYFIEKSSQLTNENIALVNILESVAQRRVQVGASSADTIQAQIEVNKLHDNLDSLKKKDQSIIAKILALMNFTQTAYIKPPGNLFQTQWNIPKNINNDELKKNNPSLILLALQTEKEKANYRLVCQDRYPDVTVGVNWIDTGKSMTPTRDSGKDAIIASVSLNLPVWTSTYRSRENSAKSQVLSATEYLSQKTQDLLAEYEDIVLRFEDAERRASLYKGTLLPQAEQALEILIESYKSGKTEFDRVLESQRILLHFQLEYERAMVDQAKAINAYEEITGACRL
ncbi:MAG: TolC family protein [Chlamydiota bacterium]|nr:TolC family protein [Chlamydiota bacterium]